MDKITKISLRQFNLCGRYQSFGFTNYQNLLHFARPLFPPINNQQI